MRHTWRVSTRQATRPPRARDDRTVVGLLSSSVALRQTVVWVVLLIAALQFAGPVQALIAQQRQTQNLRAEVAQRQSAVQDLRERKARLKDPNYIKALARARLHFVMPGETAYIVLDAPTDTGDSIPLDTNVTAAAAQAPWWVTVHAVMSQSSAVGEP